MSCKGILKLLVVLLLQTAVLVAAPNMDAGKASFKNNCASCHNKNMKDDLTGPALGGVQERWGSYPKTDLYKWIRNSQGLIASGHPRAAELWAKWKGNGMMTAFPNLSDQEIEDILAYVDGVATGKYGAAVAGAAGAQTTTAAAKPTNPVWYYGIFALLLMLAYFLWQVITDLKYNQNVRSGDGSAVKMSIWDLLTSKSVITFVVFALVLFGGYTTVNNAISLGRQQNYAPTQPIKFSHQTHAGLHKIDCNYCHDGARRSKQSLIPGVSTCMNCHKAIKKGSKYGTAEITKIFASIGFDPSTDKYIDNYDKLSNEEIEKIYSKWIASEFAKENKISVDNPAVNQEVQSQLAEIKSSLTSEVKPMISGAVEWTRIHNLPDHVYFNHSQHVTVGQVACQKCHGKVEEMPVLRQYSTLSMGWCINCHRQTDVKFQDNAYYNSYRTYHEELKSGARQSVKVADIGGLECQKCHY